MTRRLGLLLLLLAACTDAEKPSAGRPPAAALSPSPAPPPPESPTTGISKIQESYDLWLGVVTELERRADAAKTSAGTAPAREELERAVRGARSVLLAAEIAARAEARELARKRHGLLASRHTDLLSERNATAAEAAEVEGILEQVEKGTREIPAGRTLAELKDVLADLRERVRELESERTELAAKMDELAAVIDAEGEPPLSEETLLTRELEAARALVRRAEALLER
jgi:hypothetical protein